MTDEVEIKCCVTYFNISVGPCQTNRRRVVTGFRTLLRWRIYWLWGIIPIPFPVIQRQAIIQIMVHVFAQATGLAIFSSDPPCDCKCCEYRQYVHGTFTVNGARIPHPLGGGRTLHPTMWQEDGDRSNRRYGHRSDPGVLGDQYLPDQATGCFYVMSDSPGISGLRPGDTYDINLGFVSYITDVCRQLTELANARNWNVRCRGTA